MQRTLTIETPNKVGETVRLLGWVHNRRDMGKIVFLDLRDRWGMVQIVNVPAELDADSLENVKNVRSEFVLDIEGTVQKRGEKQINADLPTGTVEVLAKRVKVLAKADTPPFEVNDETKQINEELRLKYRYLDLRRDRMRKNITLRHRVIQYIRNYFYQRDFLEIETPYISKSTPEGARDFLIPSRNYQGKFYALPQSPQQYKQMLMVAGMERYFQIVRCFRDEDQRGDRQAEFTQLDVEMSFTSQDEILNLIETMLIAMVEELFPEKRLTFKPFARMSYDEAMKKYQSDKPDLRKDTNDPNELAFVWVVDFPMFEFKEGDGRWGTAHHPFTAIQPDDLPKLSKERMGKIKAQQYDLALNGSEVAGGSIRTHSPETLHKVFELLGHSDEEIQSKFGHLLEAFRYGVPPHGGIASGLDRLIMILAKESSIRDVIAFPKTADNRDPLMDSPSEVDDEQLLELGLSIRKR